MNKIEKSKKLLEDYNVDALLITSPYNRRYLSGFTGTSGAVVITSSTDYLISDFRYKTQAKEQVNDMEFVLQTSSLLEFVISFLKEKNIKTLGFEGHLTVFDTYSKLNDHFECVPLTYEIEKIRMIKSEEEINIISKACEIADETYDHILKYIKPGMKEIEVSNELEHYMRQLGATGSSFDIIVASGHRSALPHGVASNKVIEKGDMVTIDFGAYYEGYASDITRSFGIGSLSDEMEKIYHIVLESQLKALDEINNNMTGKEADKVARDVIASYGYSDNFGHSLGHGLGLEVHEGPGLSSKSDAKLENNMVVTIEPGIYVDGLGGVRIEDDVVVTEEGLKKLSHSSKDLFII